MKPCVLQAIPCGSGQPVRLEGRCDRVDGLVGKKLILSSDDKVENGGLWLRVPSEEEEGKKGGTACLVLSTPPLKDNMFPTVNLTVGQIDRLVEIGDAEIRIEVLDVEGEFGSQMAEGSHLADVKEILHKGGKNKSTGRSGGEEGGLGGSDSKLPATASGGKIPVEETVSSRGDEDAMMIDLVANKTESNSSWEGVDATSSDNGEPTSSGDESAVLVGTRSESTGSPSSIDTRHDDRVSFPVSRRTGGTTGRDSILDSVSADAESPSGSSVNASDGFVDTAGLALSSSPNDSPDSNKAMANKFAFGIKPEDNAVRNWGIDGEGFPVGATERSIEVSRKDVSTTPRKQPSYRDALTSAGPYDERRRKAQSQEDMSRYLVAESASEVVSISSPTPESKDEFVSYDDAGPDASERKGFLRSIGSAAVKAGSAVVNVITGQEPTPQPKKKQTIPPPQSWLGYTRHANTVARAATTRDSKTMKYASITVKSFLSAENISIQSLTLAAYLYNKDCVDDSEGLRALILQGIPSIALSKTPLGLSNVKERFYESDARPNIVWCDFFAGLVKGNVLRSQQPKDDVLLRMFCMWDDCGLFRKPYSLELWQNVHSSVDTQFFCRKFVNIESLMGGEKAITLGILVQSNFNDVAKFILEDRGCDESVPSKVHTHASFHTASLMKKALRSGSSPIDSSVSLWERFFFTLGAIRFVAAKNEDDTIRASVEAISFRSLLTFQGYDGLVVALDTGVDVKYLTKVKAMIRSSLYDDLTSSSLGPSMADVSNLLSSPAAPYLSSSREMDAVMKFSKVAMSSSESFDSKLRFIDVVFRILGGSSGYNGRIQGRKKFVIRSIQAAIINTDPVELLRVTFVIAAECPTMLSCEANEKFLEKVASLICDDNIGRAGLREPQCLLGLPIADVQPDTTTLHSCLVNRLEEVLMVNCTGLVEASSLFLAVMTSESIPSCTRLVSLSVHVFSFFMSRWKPTNVNELMSHSQHSLSLLLDCFEASDRYDCMPLDDSRRMEECREHLKRVVSAWSTDYKDERLMKSELDDLLEKDDGSWQLVARIADEELPSYHQIRDKTKDFVALESTISQLLYGSDNVASLQAVFNGYNCTANQGSDLYRLLTGYDWLLSRLAADDVESSSRQMLCHLREDSAAGEDFLNKNIAALLICDYFLKNSSVLFHSMIRDSQGVVMSLEFLVLSTERVKVTLSELIGPGSDFAAIRHAVGIITAAGSLVEEETSVLSGCEQLELHPSHVDSFRIVATLVESTELLQRFVDCCRQFKFEVASDPAFDELNSIVREILGNTDRSVSVQDCLEASRRLCSIMSSEHNGSDSSLSGIKGTIRKHVPVLSLLSCLSLHSEVFTFVREMNWIGKDGLKQFYEQYSNVTNVLLGNTASYEMSVLSAVEPTVRVISAVGDFRQETNVSRLLNGLEANKDVASFLESGSGRDDIAQVQTNVTHIRDWFTVGVDEVAAVHVTFDAICKTGEYYLSFVDYDENTILAPVLAIRYTSKETECVLQGEELNSFIQQVGLIQHENESTSSLVNSFVELNQVLAATASNIAYMESIGFEHTGRDSFWCMVGYKHVDHSRELLSASEAALRTCQSWLSTMRSTHFVSLLFWTDELLEIFKMVKQAVYVESGNDVLLHGLTSMLSRLFRGVGSFRERLRVVSEAIDTRKGHHHQYDSSWLVDISKFLESVHDAVRAPWREVVNEIKGHSLIVLHTIACSNDEFLGQSCRVLQDVYKDRLPEDYEVLDGLVDGTREKLTVFLERVMTFRSSTFAVVNVESLESSLLEIIISFLSNSGIATEGIRLHLIQREGTMLHSSPWIRGVRWEPDVHQRDHGMVWKALILDQLHIDQVSVVWSPRSGAGKTRYIAQELEAAGSDEIAKVTIHEGSSIETLTQDLIAKFSRSTGMKAVHFNLAFLCSGLNENSHLVSCLNRFFFSLLVLRFVRDSESACSFHLGQSNWRIFLEFPNTAADSTADYCTTWLRTRIPILYLCGSLATPSDQFVIDPEARRVCTYLRAFDDGTIDRKFEKHTNRRIVLLLDRSGSMEIQIGGGSALSVAADNAIRIFDSHVGIGDEFGVVLFDDRIEQWIQAQTVADENHRFQLRHRLDQVRNLERGGTYMYAALQHVFQSVANAGPSLETWVVCLTDGASHDTDAAFRPLLEQSRETVHLIIIGVNLDPTYEQYMQHLCGKYGRHQTEPNKGFFIRSEATLHSMNAAFDTVSRSIPVSKTFDLDGAVSDEKCRNLLDKYVPDFLDRHDMLLMSFWVQFIHRRVRVFDRNESFNFNEEHESLGSTLMRTMFGEVERLVSNNQNRDWVGKDHTQLIYDLTNEDAPEFRLLCTAPDEMDERERFQLSQLDLPGFSIPTTQDLRDRRTLDRYLSQSLNLPLKNGRLACIDDNGFILTLDFTMKLLNIHERVACRTPCVIEGETGVSKTALTRMYAILRNSVISEKAKELTLSHLDEIAESLVTMGHHIPFGVDVWGRLQQALIEATEEDISNETDIARDMYRAILHKCASRPSMFQTVPVEYINGDEARTSATMTVLDWFSSAALETTFFDVNVDSSLSEQDFIGRFVPIRSAAQKLLGSEALVVVFLDEFNTSSVLGLCKEIIVDHTLAGKALEDNIVVIAACNPSRKQVTAENPRERDLGREWAGGHYQVAELPPSVAKIKWSFGSLNHNQEKEFVLRRLDIVSLQDDSMPPYLRVALTEFISESQEAMRRFAARNIRDSLDRVEGGLREKVDCDADLRARSVVSLRDIQRVFSLFDFFMLNVKVSCLCDAPAAQIHRNAMLLAVAMVYYLRLDSRSRAQFLEMTRDLPAEKHEKTDLLDILNVAMDEVIRETEIPQGIAITRGLKENVFMTFVCTLSRTPLMIVGPPGSSKTLSVNIVADNCNGEDSPSPFYREHARLALFHYQCSKQSTSKELLAVFDKATQRQQRVDSAKHRCFVLMDEAGLPEEEKESLKVLHYLLEGHMSAKAEVGFVAISNHVLDAAKTNRCVMLLREEPDEDDMMSIAQGVLFGFRGEDIGYAKANYVDLEGTLVPAKEFALSLCQSYSDLLHDDGKDLSWFDTFFGLRDLLHFLKAIESIANLEQTKMVVTFQDIVYAIERNFNGISRHELRLVSERFLKPLAAKLANRLEVVFRDPVEVIRDSLSSPSLSSGTRFKMIIDCSGDDSILRLLSIGGIVDLSKRSMFKVSCMPQETALEELRLVSGVKFAALQGQMAVLSQTESINEAFYDLFNQRFQSVTRRDGQKDLYSNVAVGGISRRSLIRPEFECIIHVNKTDLHHMPAPFLNRFEKFRLTMDDVLQSGWKSIGSLSAVFKQSRQSTSMLLSILSESGTFAWMNDKQTLDSLFVDVLPVSLSGKGVESGSSGEATATMDADCRNLASVVLDIAKRVSSMQITMDDVHYVIDAATKYIRDDDGGVLRKMISEQDVDVAAVRDSIDSLSIPNDDTKQESRVVRILIQMLTTRVTARRLLQLATPESVFAARDCLPEVVVDDYFSQEHFSLRELVSKLAVTAKSDNRTSLSIVYTRTDSSIHSIPTHSVNRNHVLEDHSASERLRKLVYENLDELEVENLSILQSESALSSAVESWAKSSDKNILVLLVDMSCKFAYEKVNYARMCVERNDEDTHGKAFVLLLHYPSSGRDGRSSYPALFLGGWEHFYLDGIGSEDQSLGVEGLIEAACKSRGGGELVDLERITSCIVESCQHLLPRVLPHIASQNLFYPSQGQAGPTSFGTRSLMLQRVLTTEVGDSDVATILCRKFASMWADHGLLNSVKRATNNLLLGLTQLSLSTSVCAVLVETFDTFVAAMFQEMNQWRNLDILLTNMSTMDSIYKLYGCILKDIPIAPFQELFLRSRGHLIQVEPIANPSNESASVRFPFFRLVSKFIDECLETAKQRLALDKGGNDVDIVSFDRCGKELFLLAADILREEASHGLAKPVQTAVHFVEDDSNLFGEYLYHFLEWRLGCDEQPFVVEVLVREMAGYECERNIIAIHVAAEVKREQLSVAASFQGQLLDSLDCSIEVSGTMGEALFGKLLDQFEGSIFTDDLSSSEWVESFSSFFHQIPAMLGKQLVEDLRVACRLRALCFFSVLIQSSASTLSLRSVSKVWRERGSLSDKDMVAALSLENILSDDHGSGRKLVRELVLRFFIAPAWLNVTHVFKDSDSSYLMNSIANGVFDDTSDQLLVILLIRACNLNVGHDELPSLSGALAPGGALLELVSLLSCDQISVFSSIGKRTCIPHYVPEWLMREEVGNTQGISEDAEESDVFLANYVQCFHCRLSRVTFQMLLQLHLFETETMSSENHFVDLLRCIHDDVSIDRLEQTRLSRSRRAGDEQSVLGSSLSAIVLDVKLICFVAKVAQEISVDGTAEVLSGMYSREASSLIEKVMSMDHLKWQEFFIGTILRTSGEGTLASVLTNNGQLSQMTWTREWMQGIPSQMNEAAEHLREAEGALAEAVEDEEKNSRELRLCPHCNQPFSVLQLNCGAFTCGRDFHGHGPAHGCGQTFQLDTARYYVPDEARLVPLRNRLANEQVRFREHESAALLWNSASEMEVPMVSFKVERDVVQRLMLPCASFLSLEGGSECQSSVVAMVEVLLENSKRNSHFAMLPDLVEFYLWLNSTFRYLVTKERAFTLKVSDVVKQALLQKRFDSVSANHIENLWLRVAAGVNEYLEEFDQKIAWECEEIHVSFDKLEDAPLIAVLSEGEHPSDGNDVLFLIINGLIGNYNSFVRRLVECVDSDGPHSIELKEVHPKFIASGHGGAVLVSAAMPLSFSDLTMLIGSYWESQEERYDIEGLKEAMWREMSLHRSLPMIQSPSKCLRESFRFRDDQSHPLATLGERGSVHVDEGGNYFANQQDYNLAVDARKSLQDLDMSVGDPSIRRTLSDNFHTFDYDRIRLMLEGCRNLLASVSMQFLDFNTVGQVLQDMNDDNDSSAVVEALCSFGFPTLIPSHAQLMTGLSSGQFVELVCFLSYQLASEAHLFVALPLSMTDPIKDDDKKLIDSRLERLFEDNGTKLSEWIEDFTRDILSFYESQIREAASSNCSLKTFLAKENYCDDETDPIFALLPTRISVHNYISLRQHLQQRKLAFLSSEPLTTRSLRDGRVDSKTIELFTRPSRGRCWLWQDDEAVDQGLVDDDNVASSVRYGESWSLWFEDVGSQEAVGDANDDFDGYDRMDIISMESQQQEAMNCEYTVTSGGGTRPMDIDESPEETMRVKSARLVQRWWRRQLFKLDRDGDFLDDDVEYDEHMFDYLPEDDNESLVSSDFIEQHLDVQATLNERTNEQQSPEPTVAAHHPGRFTDTAAASHDSLANPSPIVERTKEAAIRQSSADRNETMQREVPPSNVTDAAAPALPAGNHSPSDSHQFDYGSASAEQAMRQWLNDNRLPASVADALLELGARDINDVVEMMLECPEILDQVINNNNIKPLDRFKLTKAAEQYNMKNTK